MTGTTLERKRTARESRTRPLVFFLTLSVLLHGTFFAQEWLLLGAGMAFLSVWMFWRTGAGWLRRAYWSPQEDSEAVALSSTDLFFAGMLLLSLAGLLNPVKPSEGWLDAVRWFTLWRVYRVACAFQEERTKQTILRWIIGLGTFLAAVGLLPWLNRFWPGLMPSAEGRVSALFGYPNAVAAYCAAVLLLKPRFLWIRALLFISLLNTGSRAALSIFLLVWVSREVLIWKFGRQRFLVTRNRRQGFLVKRRGQSLLLGLLICLGILLTVLWNPYTVTHLLDWGITNSLGERYLYIRDGLKLAVWNKGLPRAGAWFEFPLVQNIPYWAMDPHSIGIRVLLHQGLLGWIFLGGWGVWALGRRGIRVLRSLRKKRTLDRASLDALSALVFLAGHSLMDADFLFGALGFLFWILFGMFFSSLDSNYKRSRAGFLTQYRIRYLGSGILLVFGFTLLTAAAHPNWVEIPNENQQRTESQVRQTTARLEVEQKGSEGLEAMDIVLQWEKFNLRSYEWAQALVFEEAEKRKERDPQEALELYRWVAQVPERIAAVRKVSPFEEALWLGAKDFKPSEYMLLLADYAKERQLTLP